MCSHFLEPDRIPAAVFCTLCNLVTRFWLTPQKCKIVVQLTGEKCCIMFSSNLFGPRGISFLLNHAAGHRNYIKCCWYELPCFNEYPWLHQSSFITAEGIKWELTWTEHWPCMSSKAQWKGINKLITPGSVRNVIESITTDSNIHQPRPNCWGIQ